MHKVYFLIIYLSVFSNWAKAQNLVINPSVENFTGNYGPCVPLEWLTRNGSLDYIAYKKKIEGYNGWQYRSGAGISCGTCNADSCNFMGFDVANRERVLNPNEHMIKNGKAIYGDKAFEICHNDIFDSHKDEYLIEGIRVPIFVVGTFNQGLQTNEQYYFSVWLSPRYASGRGEHKSSTDIGAYFGYINPFVTSDFGLLTLTEAEFTTFDTLSRNEKRYYFRDSLNAKKLTTVNPKANVIRGNSDSDWVELKFTFTMDKDAKYFAFGIFPNSLDRERTIEKHPYFTFYNNPYHWLLNSFSYFADGFTLLPYPELGDILYVTAGDSLVLNPKVPDAHLNWYDGDTLSQTKTIYCPGTYWVRSSSAFSSVSDSVVVLAKSPWPPDTVLCSKSAKLAISKLAYNIEWSTGATDSVIYPEREDLYKVSFNMPGGCRYEIETRVNFDHLYLPKINDTTFCDSGMISFTKRSNHNYQWKNGDSSNQQHFTNAVDYWLMVENKHCRQRLNFRVDIENKAQLHPKDSLICNGFYYDFKPNINYPIIYLSEEKLRYFDSTDIIIKWNQPVCGELYDTFKLRVQDCYCEAFVPSAITVNNDGLNEQFIPIIDCELEEYNLRIYNRWGQEIFSTQNEAESWQPQNIPLGQYYYLLSYKDAYTKKEHFLHGSISLIH